MERKILVTGDYSHRDFRGLLEGRDLFTLAPIDQASRLEPEFDLIIIAQAYPDQISARAIESLRNQFPATPMVAVLGTWCEGESRSGKPWPGVIRIYWHQWSGRYAQFSACLEKQGVSDWHEPPTASISDRILRADAPHPVLQTHQRIVGISASASPPFEMLKDAFAAIGWKPVWIELSLEADAPSQKLDLICIDANALDEELEQRIRWLRQNYPDPSMIVVANFPRAHEVQKLISWRVSQIVSKPFELSDLSYAIKAAVLA